MEDGKGAEEDGFKVGSSLFALVFHKEACDIFFIIIHFMSICLTFQWIEVNCLLCCIKSILEL